MAPVNRLNGNGKKAPAFLTQQLSEEDLAELLRLKTVAEDCAMEQREAMARAQLAQVAVDAVVLKLQRKYGLTLGDVIAMDGSITKEGAKSNVGG